MVQRNRLTGLREYIHYYMPTKRVQVLHVSGYSCPVLSYLNITHPRMRLTTLDVLSGLAELWCE